MGIVNNREYMFSNIYVKIEIRGCSDLNREKTKFS